MKQVQLVHLPDGIHNVNDVQGQGAETFSTIVGNPNYTIVGDAVVVTYVA